MCTEVDKSYRLMPETTKIRHLTTAFCKRPSPTDNLFFLQSDSNETNGKLILMLVMNHSFSSYFVFTPKSNLCRTSARPERMWLTYLAIPLSRRKRTLTTGIPYTFLMRARCCTRCAACEFRTIGATWNPDCNHLDVDSTCACVFSLFRVLLRAVR